MHSKLAVWALGAAVLTAQLPTFSFKLVYSEPAAAIAFKGAPSRIRLIFSESIDAAKTKVSITGPDGHAINLVPVRNPNSSGELTATVPPISPGPYHVAYTGVSAKGESITGDYAFTLLSDGAQPAVVDTEIIVDGDANTLLPPAVLRIIERVLALVLAGLILMRLRARKKS